MNLKFKKHWIALISPLALLPFFQNCSKGFSSKNFSYGSSDSASSLTGINKSTAISKAVCPIDQSTLYFSAVETNAVVGFALGSKQSPFDVSTASKFNSVVSQVSEGPKTLFFGPGIYNVSYMPVKNGWRICGSGPDQTTFRLPDNTMNANTNQVVIIAHWDFLGLLDSASVQDLKIDGNKQNQASYQNNSSSYIGAIALFARNSLISNVEVVNTYTNFSYMQNGEIAYAEGFPVSLYTSQGTLDQPSVAEIAFVKVIKHEGYATSISIFDQTGFWVSGSIHDCVVEGYGDYRSSSGFGSGGWLNMKIERNITRNIPSGIVIDTHLYKNVLIKDNIFEGVSDFGILANGGSDNQYDHISYINNRISIVSITPEYDRGVAFKFDASAHTNFLIKGNIVTSTRTPGRRKAIFIQASRTTSDLQTGSIEYNLLSPEMIFDLWQAPNIFEQGNKNTHGLPMSAHP